VFGHIISVNFSQKNKVDIDLETAECDTSI
jgi:hypothetical protein